MTKYVDFFTGSKSRRLDATFSRNLSNACLLRLDFIEINWKYIFKTITTLC